MSPAESPPMSEQSEILHNVNVRAWGGVEGVEGSGVGVGRGKQEGSRVTDGHYTSSTISYCCSFFLLPHLVISTAYRVNSTTQ